jgi:hypothetical protein
MPTDPDAEYGSGSRQILVFSAANSALALAGLWFIFWRLRRHGLRSLVQLAWTSRASDTNPATPLGQFQELRFDLSE